MSLANITIVLYIESTHFKATCCVHCFQCVFFCLRVKFYRWWWWYLFLLTCSLFPSNEEVMTSLSAVCAVQKHQCSHLNSIKLNQSVVGMWVCVHCSVVWMTTTGSKCVAIYRWIVCQQLKMHVLCNFIQ